MRLSSKLAFAVLLLFAAPAEAHRLKVFASAEGAAISGYAYFSGGGRARGTEVIAAGPDGTPVFQGVTGGEGEFAFQATRRMDHIIIVDGADGHRASFTLHADEIPAHLPAGAEAAAIAPTPDAVLDEAIARQIRPLREQIEAYQDEIRLRDIIGGIGYIVGLAGLAFGFSRRRV